MILNKIIKKTLHLEFWELKDSILNRKKWKSLILHVKNRIQFLLKKKIIDSISIRLTKRIHHKSDIKNLMINIGGGRFFRKHWRVLDYESDHYSYESHYIDYNFNLMSNKPLPFKDNEVKFFFSSHTIEHIPEKYCQLIFNEIFRCLRPGGAFRLTMPDFDLAYNAYMKEDLEFFKNYKGTNIEVKFLDFFATYMKDKISIDDFKENFRKKEKEDFANHYINQIPIQSQKDNPGHHVNWWNYEKAEKFCQKAGFKIIYSSTPQKSKFKEMRGFGVNEGFDSRHPELSLFLEAIK